jgi:hypothetical protein
MRKTLIALVLATFFLGVPAYGETREAIKLATELTGTANSTVTPTFGQIRIQVGRDRRHRRWEWRRDEYRRYRYHRYPYSRW